jgi:hypothetical protein
VFVKPHGRVIMLDGLGMMSNEEKAHARSYDSSVYPKLLRKTATIQYKMARLRDHNRIGELPNQD